MFYFKIQTTSVVRLRGALCYNNNNYWNNNPDFQPTL